MRVAASLPVPELLLAAAEDDQLVPPLPGDVPGGRVLVEISLLALGQVCDLHVAVIVVQCRLALVCTGTRPESGQSRWLPVNHHHPPPHIN